MQTWGIWSGCPHLIEWNGWRKYLGPAVICELSLKFISPGFLPFLRPRQFHHVIVRCWKKNSKSSRSLRLKGSPCSSRQDRWSEVIILRHQGCLRFLWGNDWEINWSLLYTVCSREKASKTASVVVFGQPPFLLLENLQKVARTALLTRLPGRIVPMTNRS